MLKYPAVKVQDEGLTGEHRWVRSLIRAGYSVDESSLAPLYSGVNCANGYTCVLEDKSDGALGFDWDAGVAGMYSGSRSFLECLLKAFGSLSGEGQPLAEGQSRM